MSEAHEAFDAFDPPATAEEGGLMVAVDGFEGPLDLLLALARNQKVDLARISILMLADQYLGFIESAKKLNLEDGVTAAVDAIEATMNNARWKLSA